MDTNEIKKLLIETEKMFKIKVLEDLGFSLDEEDFENGTTLMVGLFEIENNEFKEVEISICLSPDSGNIEYINFVPTKDVWGNNISSTYNLGFIFNGVETLNDVKIFLKLLDAKKLEYKKNKTSNVENTEKEEQIELLALFSNFPIILDDWFKYVGYEKGYRVGKNENGYPHLLYRPINNEVKHVIYMLDEFTFKFEIKDSINSDYTITSTDFNDILEVLEGVEVNEN